MKIPSKGNKVYFESENKLRLFKDKQDIKQYLSEIVGEKVFLLEKKKQLGSAHFEVLLKPKRKEI